LNFPNPFRKKDDPYRQQLEHDITVNESAQPSQEELENANVVEKFAYVLVDDNVQYLLKNNTILMPLYPTFSLLNSTIRLTKIDAIILYCKVRFQLLLIAWNMDEEEYQTEGAITLESLKYYFYCRINEAIDGWKGRMITEQHKIIETQVRREKKG
jgi:hypothetical protein